ncbi:MAG TPA: hypothetical protein PL112_21705 [Candidatus Obscuribacter sp.]|nr:hypothetical protein [Candidatus Obscuribacter sp.]HMX48068.1 hypothetical protein [Candidatus Obscuribacter sp.]HND05391.1 hypothetical protein [Candidatus Obscuribacter sp.]HND69437.1 hypothetical protein [Candidatus Obscuribacter sp.]
MPGNSQSQAKAPQNKNAVAQSTKPSRPVGPATTLPDLSVKRYPTATRTLVFPGNRSWGGIVVTDEPVIQFPEGDTAGWMIQALGTIKIPLNKFVTFCPNFIFFDNPHGLDKLPAKAFDSVLLHFMAMEDKDNGKGDRALAALNRCRTIRSIDCNKAKVSDEGPSQIGDLQELESHYLFSTEVKGTFLKNLSGCRKLRLIDLAHTSLDPNNLLYLRQYKNLQKLGLMRTGAKGPNLTPLGQCSNLQSLDLAYNPDVDDTLVAALKPLKKLKFVRLKGTSITDRGLKELNALGIHANRESSTPPATVSPTAKEELTRKQDIERILAPTSR